MRHGPAAIARAARAAGTAIPAFNIPSLPMVKPVVGGPRDGASMAFVAEGAERARRAVHERAVSPLRNVYRPSGTGDVA